jgi:hypothetical protein
MPSTAAGRDAPQRFDFTVDDQRGGPHHALAGDLFYVPYVFDAGRDPCFGKDLHQFLLQLITLGAPRTQDFDVNP